MADPFVARPLRRSARRRALGRLPLARLPLALVAAALAAGCQEKLTSPGQCPDLCPGGQLEVVDTTLDALPGRDSSYLGYVAAGAGQALLLASGLPGSEDRPIIRFGSRPDSVPSIRGGDTVFYDIDSVIDSVALEFNVRARDTTVSGVRVVLYRLPTTIDSTATFAGIDPLLVDANLIDTVIIPTDSVNYTARLVLRGDKLSRVAIDTADKGVLAIGMRLAAPQPTGLRISSAAASIAFTTYYTVDVEGDDDDFSGQYDRIPAFGTFVSQGTPAFDPDLLLVGGEPSARALLRFNLPARLRDSVSIVRATLELVPAEPLFGLPNDPAFLEAFALRSDLGAKSPVCAAGGVCGGTLIGRTLLELPEGSADTVRFEIPQIVRSWQGTSGAPPALFLGVLRELEAATFTRPVFFSTRSGAGAPRLRISYVPLSSSTSP